MKTSYDAKAMETLQKLGLSEKEASVYVALLRLGQADISDIAEQTGLKRPIIYVIIESLLSRGFATVLPHIRKKTYRASQPEMVLNYFQGATLTLASMLKYFEEIQSKDTNPRITAYDSVQSIMTVWDDAQHSDNLCFVTSLSKLEQNLGSAWNKLAQHAADGTYRHCKKWRILNTDGLLSSITKDEELLRASGAQIKIFEGRNNYLDFALYDSKTAITTITQSPFLVVIDSKIMNSSFRSFFDALWEGSQVRKSGKQHSKK